MAREVTLKCDFCGKQVDQVASKLYLAPVLPGKASTSFMAGYTFWADVCDNCMNEMFIPKMKRRKARVNGDSKKTTTKKRQRKIKT